MFQLIVHRPLPPTRRAGRLTDPDLLLALAERVRCCDPGDQTCIDEFSLVLSDLRMGGTWKQTNRGRLTTAQDKICEYLVPRDGNATTVLDLGASEGLTTVELAAALRRRFHAHIRVLLADLNLWLLRYRSGPVYEYRASSGEPIMAKLGRLGLRLARQRHVQSQKPDPLVALYLGFQRFRSAMKQDEKIYLVHPLVERDPAISVVELDCLIRNDLLCDTVDAVRASNILNPGYFSVSQMNTALANIHSYLVEGGSLVVSRNLGTSSGDVENGSVWRKSGAVFRRIADFGSGSEIGSVVDSWVPERSRASAQTPQVCSGDLG
jgi:chemotaxis methyl-accepting protein methylase